MRRRFAAPAYADHIAGRGRARLIAVSFVIAVLLSALDFPLTLQ
jgi:hypothetical protein